MAEISYAPDPRATTTTPQSRRYGPASLPSELTATGADGTAYDFFEEYTAGTLTLMDKGVGWLTNGVISGCSIVSRVAPASDARTFKALSISNGQFGRRMPWGDRWNRIKLVVLWRLNGSASFNTTATDALLGICSGTTNMTGSATTDNFVGLRWGSGAGDGITFTAGTLINYYNMSTAYRIVSRRATTTTAIGSGGSGHLLPATEGYMGAIVLNVGRPVFATDASSVTYSYMEISNDATQVEFPRQKDLIKYLLQDVGTSIVSASSNEQLAIGASSGTITGAFDQTTGKLDTVNIFWPFTSANATLEICGYGVRKIA